MDFYLKDYKVGDYIKDIEDGDFWFEGIITKIINNYHLEYKLQKVYFDGEYIDKEIGIIITRRWSWLEKLIDETRDQKINKLLNNGL